MKYKIKINYEEELEANSQEEAMEVFWETKNDINTNIDNFFDDITSIEEVKGGEKK